MQTEEKLQAQCFCWHWNTYPQFRRCLFHVPNGGYRAVKEAYKFKAIGVLAGVSDFIYMIGGQSIAIELKKGKGRQSKPQKQFQETHKEHYYIVRNFEEFKSVVNNFHRLLGVA